MTSEHVKWPLTGGKRPRDDLWDSIDAGVIAKIKEHPFITGIIDGSLKEDIFRCKSYPTSHMRSLDMKFYVPCRASMVVQPTHLNCLLLPPWLP